MTETPWEILDAWADREGMADGILKDLSEQGYVIVPRECSNIMAMRGAQANTEFYGELPDMAQEYFSFSEDQSDLLDKLKPNPRDDEDDRAYWLVASIWRGCIRGMEEWDKRRADDGDTDFIKHWLRPYFQATKEWIAKAEGAADPQSTKEASNG